MTEISYGRVHWWTREFTELVVNEQAVYVHKNKKYALMPDGKLHAVRDDGRVLRRTIALAI